MKKSLIIILIISALLTACSKDTTDYSALKTEEIVDHIVKYAPVEFGYCDVSDYYMKNYFSDLRAPLEYRIFTCNESSNFNEFGVFKFSDEGDAEDGLKVLRHYLNTSKEEFENGIIYDINEYPKFTNARMEKVGVYLIYTILNKNEADSAFAAIKHQNK